MQLYTYKNYKAMTAKEKAIELVERFKYRNIRGVEVETMSISLAKQCALICVDEVLDAVTTIADKRFDFYTEVKKEIEKI